MLRLGRQTKRVVFISVNSHVGITKNELADMMAVDRMAYRYSSVGSDQLSRYEVRLETLSREGNREEIIRLQQFLHDATARINVEGGGKRKVPSTTLESQKAEKKAKMGAL